MYSTNLLHYNFCMHGLAARTMQSLFGWSMMLICVFDCSSAWNRCSFTAVSDNSFAPAPVKMQLSQGCLNFWCREYKQDFEEQQKPHLLSRMYPPFAPIAAISFPFFWAPSFGEFGSASWRKWAVQFKQCQIQTRCCVWHALDLTRGV